MMDRTKMLAASWQKNAAHWTKAVREGLIASRQAGTDAAIVDAVVRQAPSRFLDMGCGEGWLVRRIARETGCLAVGFDGSAQLIAEARAADPQGCYEVVSYQDILNGTARRDGPFDVIAFNYALFDEAAAALLATVKDDLAPGGVIIIQTLHPWAANDGTDYCDGWRTEDFAAFESDGWSAMPWFFRTLESWHKTLRDAGLCLLEIKEPTAKPGETPLSLLMVCDRHEGQAKPPTT